MKAANEVFKRGRASDWTLERIARLSVQDIKQLRANAERLHEPDLAAMCSDALRCASPAARSRARGKSVPGTRARSLIPRTRAFEARGVWLQDPKTSWSGQRKSDGVVVIALWADAIESAEGGCQCLLWAPNVDGSRPWSDQIAGRERMEHCRRAAESGRAEGLLVYGERLEGRLPEDKARAVHGVDPETVVVFQVEKRGTEFWAQWGGKAPASFGSG